MENEDNNNNENNNINNIEVVIGDSSNLSFSEVGDFMGDLKPQNVKGLRKNIIIPTNKIVDKDSSQNNEEDSKKEDDTSKENSTDTDEKENNIYWASTTCKAPC